MPKVNPIGRAEMEILRYVQDHHPVTVRAVADHMAESRGLVRTTVLNVMERLREKRHLTRKRVGGFYEYSPAVPKPDLLRRLVRDFVDGTLGGSLSPFVAYLTKEASLSPAELQELKQVVRELDDAGKGKP